MTRAEYAALLRNLTVNMAVRYGFTCQSSGYAILRGQFEGKTVEQWQRASERQLSAIRRLTLATLRLAKEDR